MTQERSPKVEVSNVNRVMNEPALLVESKVVDAIRLLIMDSREMILAKIEDLETQVSDLNEKVRDLCYSTYLDDPGD